MGSWTDFSEPVFTWLVQVHLAVGLVALVLFWVGVFSRKGGPLHIYCGRVFVSCVYAVAAAALIVVAYRLAVPVSPEQLNAGRTVENMEEIAAINQSVRLLLAYLALIAVIHARHGIRVIRTRHHPETINMPLDRFLAYGLVVSGGGMIVLGVVAGPWLRMLFLLFSPLGFAIAWDILSYLRNPRKTPKNWWYAHMDAMLSCGILLHTAFAVIGAGRLLHLDLESSWGLLPVLPLAVGVLATRAWKRAYRRQFGELPLPRVQPDPVPLENSEKQ